MNDEKLNDEKYVASIFCGATTGLLKGLDLGARTVANHYGPNELNINQEIQRLYFAQRRVLCAMKNGGLKIFDTEKKAFNFPVRLWNNDCFQAEVKHILLSLSYLLFFWKN